MRKKTNLLDIVLKDMQGTILFRANNRYVLFRFILESAQMKNSVNHYPMKFLFKRHAKICGIVCNSVDGNKYFAIDLFSHIVIESNYIGQGVMFKKFKIDSVKIIIITEHKKQFAQLISLVLDNVLNPSAKALFILKFKIR